jgi:hypothetical protein
MLNSQDVNPVALPPGRETVDEAGSNRTLHHHEHDRQGMGRLQQRRCTRMASGEDDVGRERGQFVRLSANCGGIGCGPAGVDLHIAA